VFSIYSLPRSCSCVVCTCCRTGQNRTRRKYGGDFVRRRERPVGATEGRRHQLLALLGARAHRHWLGLHHRGSDHLQRWVYYSVQSVSCFLSVLLGSHHFSPRNPVASSVSKTLDGREKMPTPNWYILAVGCISPSLTYPTSPNPTHTGPCLVSSRLVSRALVSAGLDCIVSFPLV